MSADTVKLIGDAERDVRVLLAALEAAERRFDVFRQERDAIAESLNAAEAQRDTLAAALRDIEYRAATAQQAATLARAALAAVEPPEEQKPVVPPANPSNRTRH